MGNNAVSLAQLKCVEVGEMACFRGVWGEQECTGGAWAIDSEQGVSMGVNSVINDVAGVWDMGGSGMSCFWGFWGKLGS